ncbi:TetR/AcrR family transcriptional regulator [Roseovarius sp. 2305UL8-3]|uniref:TetR/AcrR family transcriptional regulator n=1 Tax=Roseovarius conchicola TaxID=3121636 RepID=UPI0035296D62
MVKGDTRTRVMDLAEDHLRRKGADGVSYADLSKGIGIRKASIHYHFPAKSDLLSAVMARYGAAVLGRLDDTWRLPHAAHRVEAFLDLYREALDEGSRLCLCVAYSVAQDHLHPDTQAEIARFREAVITWLMSVFEAGRKDGSIEGVGDLSSEAAAALALAEGAQIAARLRGSVHPFDQATRGLRDRLKLAPF